MRNAQCNLLLMFAIVATLGNVSAADAAGFGWRGDGSGRFPKANPPTEWDAEAKKNIRWSLKVGVSKFTSPIVVGDKIFVVSEPAELICVNAATGSVLWQKSNGVTELPAKAEEKVPKGSPKNATPIPVCDGHFIYVSFGSGIVACYDLDGARQWIQHFDGAATSEFGRSASPAIAGDKLVVSIHHLIALDAKTGKVAWQNEKVPEKFGTPVPMNVGGVDVLLCPSGQVVRVKDGLILGAIPEMPYASAVVNGSVVYCVGVTTTALEFSPPTSDSIQTKTVWTTDLEGTFYASPVFDNGLLYAASNEGNFYVIDAKDGKVVTTKELEINNASGRFTPPANIYPSLSIAGKFLFLGNDAAEMLVLEPGRDYKELHKNKLLEGSGGTPAFAGSYIYIRDGADLICVGEK